MLWMVRLSSRVNVTATGPAKPCALAVQEPLPSVVAATEVDTVAASSVCVSDSAAGVGRGCGSSGVSSVAA